MASNLGIDEELLDEALKVGGEKTKKATVNKALQEFVARRWLAQQREKIEAYNEEARKHGIWSDGLRRW